MSIRKNIKLKNNFSEIKKLNDFLGEFIQQNLQNKSIYQAIQLSLEEIFNNILLYAYPDNQPHEISIQFIIDNSAIQIAIEDDGIPFNPLNMKKPEISTPLRERQVGGLGIHLIRSLMDQVAYQRSKNKNRLYIKKNLTG
jgi:anti-sigma regulatory factor (Ser/Thr protein kinase)